MNSDEDNMNTAAISNNSGQFSAANHTVYRNQISGNEESQSVSTYVFSDSSQERDHGLLSMDDIKNDSDWQVSLAEVCADGNGNFPEKSSDVIMLVSCSSDQYPNANPFPVSLNDISEHLSSPHLATRRQKAKDKYEIYENSKKNCANMGHCNKENRDPQMEYSWTVMADSKMGKRDNLPVLELLSSTMSFQENPCNCNNTMDSCICTAVSSEVDSVVEPFDRAGGNQDKDCSSARYHEWPLVRVNIEPSYDIQSSLNESQSLPSSVNQDLIETVNDRWHSPSNSAETLFINNLSSTISTYISEDCNHSYISSRDTNESFDFDVEDSLHKIEDKDHDYMFDFPEHPSFESNFNRHSAIDSGNLNKKQNSSYHLSDVNEDKNLSSVLMNVSAIDFRNTCISDDLGACKETNNFSSAVEELTTGLTRTANCSEEHCLLRRLHDYDPNNEPIHMTLEEVKTSLQQLAQGSSYHRPETEEEAGHFAEQNNLGIKNCARSAGKRTTFNIHLRQKKGREISEAELAKGSQHRKSFPSSIKQTFCSIFGGKKNPDTEEVYHSHSKSNEELSCSDLTLNLLNTPSQSIPSLSPFANRALPPLPLNEDTLDQHLTERDSCIDENEISNDPHNLRQSESMDFTASIHKVKDYGWYWGPISGETAEKILANEPDGSFIVRDSSDEHYIFSLTFKLNGMVRHVRIEHDQGNFSFGTFTNFKSQTIVGFIENAVEHSRSGRYLFFLHRRPVLGPMRVQLLHPVSRFKQIQSLQHMCRFVILKAVRRDLIDSLPLPKRLKHYLNTPQYYTEDVDITPADVNQPDLTPEHDLVHGNIELR